ncbi:MAG: YfcC family protein [Ruminococcaceae bacterium]|nr:YfcC family protein [Oscillospiraceae bacterium]
MDNSKQSKGLGISTKSFIAALAILFVLMCLTYVVTFVVPGGEYQRATDENGAVVIVSDSFSYVDGGLPFWKWLCSPVLVLGAEGSGTIIAVIAFLLVVGGIFNALDKSGLMKYMLDKIVHRFGAVRYKLLAVVILFFMAMGAFIGSFEECVPLVPIVVGLAVALGFDELTGLGMSLLAIGCGFSSGVCNPFTIGVAQEIAGLPMFSGMWLRLVAFVLIYGLVVLFVYLRAKKVAKPLSEITVNTTFESDKKMDRGLIAFVAVLGTGIAAVLSSVWITALQDYTMIIVALMFLIAGISAVLLSGMKLPSLGKHFINGLVSILPAVLMILMASSIKYTLTEGKILDTLLYSAVELAEKLPTPVMVLFIYLIVLVMNFFISSGSAKAFLLMPLIVPLAQIFGISSQLAVLAFGFGDGFSNILYPTNPVLLISLGLAGVSYTKWFKWTWKLQLAILVLTSALLMLGYVIGY